MIFEVLYGSALKGELLLIDGGYCRWHLRRNGQLTILEIISLRRGAGSRMLEILKHKLMAKSIFAKCPSDLLANKWYERRGFVCEGEEITRTGRKLILWRLYV